MNKTLKKIWYETVDLLQGAAFPFIVSIVLCATVMNLGAYAAVADLGIAILVVVVGELMMLAAYFIFGRQNGIVAYRKKLVYLKKEELGNTDLRTEFRTGSYEIYKGVLIPFISALPCCIFYFVQILAPNTFCEFIMMYAFGWIYYPFDLANLSEWFGYLCLIPLCGVHLGAYIYGASVERKRQEKMEKAKTTIKGNRNK